MTIPIRWFTIGLWGLNMSGVISSIEAALKK